MRLLRIALAVAAVLATVAVKRVAAEPQVAAIALGESGGMARLVLYVSEAVPFRLSYLTDPDRIVLDFPRLAWPARPASEGADGGGLVRGLRTAQFDHGTSRLVLDLTGPALVRESGYLPAAAGGGQQLVLTIQGAGVARRAVPGREARPRTIAIDPGHGGVDGGAVGPGGTREKDVTLAVARELRRQLEATGRYRVVATRDDDVAVRLRDRVAIAREAGAELLLSIHADSLGSGAARGASVYSLADTASDAEAAAFAQRENRADAAAGFDFSAVSPDVGGILLDLLQQETNNLSAGFAALALGEIGRDVPLLSSQPHRFAGLAVLRAPDIPSVLLELGYISNRRDEALLVQPEHQTRIAAAIVRAVDRFFAR